MSPIVVCLVAAQFVLAADGSTSAIEPTDSQFKDRVIPITEAYCAGCHSGREPKADLSFDSLSPDFVEHGTTWESIVERINNRTMPPKGKPQPSADERNFLSEWITTRLSIQASKESKVNGRARLRRLNRMEYANTIRDLLGAEVDIEQLPEDGIAGGFDNVDAALDVSSSLMESYLETIDEALDSAFARGPPPVSSIRHIDMVALAKQQTKTNRPLPRFGISTRIRKDDIVLVSAAMVSKPVIDALAKDAGLYRFRMAAHSVHRGQPMTLLVYKGNYGQGVQGLLTRPVEMLDIPDQPTIVEFSVALEPKETISLAPYGMPNIYTEVAADYDGPGLAVRWIEVEGPINHTWPPEQAVRLLDGIDLAVATISEAELIVRRFATRAFRRPIDDAELSPYLGLMESKLALGYDLEAALRVGLKGILCSPQFLYLTTMPGKLNDFDLASRLSYFLWSTMPDAALIDLASRGELGDPQILQQQVERMLDDPRSKAFTENFVGQWLSLRNLKATIPDKKLYPDFDEWLEYSMPRETYGFFEEVLRNNLSVLEFWHSDWSMLNERLALHYGIPNIRGSSFRKVELPSSSHRGGVLTQAAILKVTANGTNTSPVIRGAWVLDHLLGTPALPPPKDVPAIEPDIRGAKTIREQLSKHREAESCATCHASIDPIGNALESFDVIGGWREFYRVVPGNGRPQVQVAMFSGRTKGVGRGLDVNATDVLSDGRSCANIDDFKRFVLEKPEPLARALTEKLLVYATGHRLELIDRESVDAILASAKSTDYGFRTLIHELVQSPVFRNK